MFLLGLTHLHHILQVPSHSGQQMMTSIHLCGSTEGVGRRERGVGEERERDGRGEGKGWKRRGVQEEVGEEKECE